MEQTLSLCLRTINDTLRHAEKGLQAAGCYESLSQAADDLRGVLDLFTSLDNAEIPARLTGIRYMLEDWQPAIENDPGWTLGDRIDYQSVLDELSVLFVRLSERKEAAADIAAG